MGARLLSRVELMLWVQGVKKPIWSFYVGCTALLVLVHMWLKPLKGLTLKQWHYSYFYSRMWGGRCCYISSVCVRAYVSVTENLAVQCAALVRKKEKKSEVFFFDSRHIQGDKLGVSVWGILGATTTESWNIQETSYYVIGFTGF